jgi:uncharacterized protein YndB with AHSA1/START domain
MSVQNNGVVRIEREFKISAERLFDAIADGRLFLNCGGWPGNLKMDARSGGSYAIDFADHGFLTYGEFERVARPEALVFSWCWDGGNRKTRVSMDIKTLGPSQCRISLVHEGFASDKEREDHEWGWNDGFNDLATELEGRHVRSSRVASVAVETLYSRFAKGSLFSYMPGFDPRQFEFRVGARFDYKLKGRDFGRGEFKEILPERKVVFSWFPGTAAGETEVRVYFAKLDEGRTRLDLVHRGFQSASAAEDHRAGWQAILEALN